MKLMSEPCKQKIVDMYCTERVKTIAIWAT